MAQLNLTDVRKSFGAVDVIKGVDIDIEDGEFVILVGPSGCGKSTLLRMVAGLETVTSGSIKIGEREVKNLKAKERDIAMVFQSYALYPHMTVGKNMGFALKLQGTPKSEIDARVRDAADILNLTDYLDRYPKQLSGGQRQRVAMGRAIVRNPRVFLFDEPLSNLDAKLRVQMRSEIKQLHQRLGNTIIYVTHDQIEAMTMADKIVILSAGEVEQIGTPLELYDRPRNKFVAGFIGSPSMNFLDGQVNSDGMVVIEGGGTLPLPSRVQLSAGSPVTIGIRPEHLLLGGTGQGNVPVTIAVLEPTGAETHVMGRIGTTDIVAVVRERLTEKPGEVLSLSADPAQMHIFDAQTGLRIEN